MYYLICVVLKSKARTILYRYERPCRKEETCNPYAPTSCSSGNVNRTTCCTRDPFLLLHHTRYTHSWTRTQSCPISSVACDSQSTRIPEMYVSLITGDPSVVRNARGNGRLGIARRAPPVKRAFLAAFVTREANRSLGHGRRQIRDDMIMSPVIEQVDPIRWGYLAVKHDFVAPQTRLHDYPIFGQMALKCRELGDPSSSTEIVRYFSPPF